MERLRWWLLALLLLSTGIALWFDRQSEALISIAFGILIGIFQISEIWDKLRPVTSKKSAATIREEDYLLGRLEMFTGEREYYVPLSGEVIEPTNFLDSRSPNPFNRELSVKRYENLLYAAKDYRKFVIIGEPGAGKTTFLLYLLTQVAEHRLTSRVSNSRGEINFILGRGHLVPLPLWINLGKTDNPAKADELIEHWWNAEAGYGLPGDPFLALRNGMVWLLLDGLNEMPEQNQSQVNRANSIQSLLLQYPELRVIITCREKDYDVYQSLGLPIIRISPLDDEQREEFLKKRIKESYRLNNHIKALHDINYVTRNPLTLGSLAKIFETREDYFPRDVNQLYTTYIDLFMKEQKEFAWRTSDLDSLKSNLGKLAYRMIATGSGSAVDFYWVQRQIGLKDLQTSLSLGVLVQGKASHSIRFRHESWLMFFALPLASEALTHRWYDRIMTKRAARFARGLGDLGRAAHPAVPALLTALSEGNVELKTAALEALGEIGAYHPRLSQSLIGCLSSPDWNVRAAAAKTIGHLSSTNEVDNYSTELIKLLTLDDDSRVQVAAAFSLGKVRPVTPQGISTLIASLYSVDDNVSQVAEEALLRIGDQAVPYLISKLHDADFDIANPVPSLLAKIGTPAIPALQEKLYEADSHIRWMVVGTLGRFGIEAMPSLLVALKDESEKVRNSTLAIIADMGEIATLHLIEAIDNKVIALHFVDLDTLIRISSDSCVSLIMNWRKQRGI